MAIITISSLTIYPVKSLAGISLQSSELTRMGLKYDRRWMVVSPEGEFLTQRKKPQMALIKTAIKDGQLVLSKKGMNDQIIPFENNTSTKQMSVTIWQDTVLASLVGNESDVWLSNALGFLCHLVYMEDDTLRQCNLDYAQKDDQTGFADAFPILFISEASLNNLNAHLIKSGKETVGMRRFRPNVVVSGCEAHAEDTWKSFQVAKIPMKGVKMCDRCILTTVDPDKGERSGNEPLMTLAKYRKFASKVYFGMNVIHQELGLLKIGDELRISSTQKNIKK